MQVCEKCNQSVRNKLPLKKKKCIPKLYVLRTCSCGTETYRTKNTENSVVGYCIICEFRDQVEKIEFVVS